MIMNKIYISLVITLFCAQAVKAQSLPVYLDEAKDIEVRVEDALRRMTLDEKIRVIHAQSKFSSAGVPRLGFPDFWTDDGPHGVRPDVLWDEWEQAGQTNDSCVAFPALTCLAATWNPQLSLIYGESLGEEALYRGKNMILGPSGQNIYPEEIEAKLNNMTLVMESLVVERDSKLVAIVYPDFEMMDRLGFTSEQLPDEMEKVRKELNKIVAPYEQISKIQLIANEFEKTPKKSIKRYLYTN